LSALIDHITELAKTSGRAGLIIDCTSSDLVARQYPHWLYRGLHIATPNKKAFSGELGLWRELVKATTKKPGIPYPLCFHESTVGAGLPVISTLKDLLLTGDKIIRIEGVFSGTLSYLFNEFSAAATVTNNNDNVAGGRKFSEIVKDAKDKGYTVIYKIYFVSCDE
jgi:homoserine dehydrogenase